MTISQLILDHFPDLNEAQRRIVGHQEGPLLVIAGPGSGKTYSIVLRALNLLLTGAATPREMVLCTFTEKAAFEMRDRLSTAARKVGYQRDLSELTISTIHGYCNELLLRHRHGTSLGHNHTVLDELGQLLFIFEHFDEIIGAPVDDVFLHRWRTKWTTIQGAKGYFDKITEELIEPCELESADDSFLRAIGRAYAEYERLLLETNRADFAHLQKIVHAMLNDPKGTEVLRREVRYVMVDEYQDTNYVQDGTCPPS